MTKQVIEAHFKKDVQKQGLWIDKLQVNIFAFTSVAADYLIQHPKYDVLVEVKQVTQSKNKYFYIARFTQESAMKEFVERFERNRAYLFLSYWIENKSRAISFLIPIKVWLSWRLTNDKSKNKVQCLTKEYCEVTFNEYIVPVKEGHWVFLF